MSLLGNLLKTAGNVIKTAAPALLPGALTGVAGLAAAGISKLIGGKAASQSSAPISTASNNFVAVQPGQQQTSSLVIRPDGTIEAGKPSTPVWVWPVVIGVFAIIVVPMVLYFIFKPKGSTTRSAPKKSPAKKGGKK